MFKSLLKHKFSKIILILAAAGIIISGLIFLWALFIAMPTFGRLENIKSAESTKIYDRTGNVILYDVYGEVKRTYIPFDEIPRNLKNATIAIEDDNFYQHNGISILSIFRAFGVNLLHGRIKQGGSTITQQLIKNTFLTPEQTLTRKVKELILALKIEKKYSKDEILNFYLNEIPYGSNNYGAEAASEGFFGKHAKDLDLAESAYLAALPKAPTHYSPFGEHRDELERRKNLVLQRLKDLNYISEAEFNEAKAEKVKFLSQKYQGIKAPHFVMYIRDELVKKYGEEMVEKGGLKVTTTLDWELQDKAEQIVSDYAKQNEKNFNAKNAGMTAIDPKTGQILVMVGSRNYFDTQNEGNFNVTTAKRQPGSSFKPFVYATAFKKGYTPDTVVFDLPTNFGSQGAEPYTPQNYDNIFRGPISLRNALAQSVNIPAVKILYLAGIKDSLQTARDLGITTLAAASRYGLTLVLGGGEVKLLEMTGAYAAFANDGKRNDITGILEVKDKNDNVLYKFRQRERQVIDSNISRMITDILTDNTARTPAFGNNSYLYFPGKQIAVKTGTTNNYRDAWIIGYTPNFSLGVWSGNNDNTPMQKKVAGFIVAPMWHAFFEEAFKKYPPEDFPKPDYSDKPSKPVLNGEWHGSRVYNGSIIQEIHDILYWVDKDNPRGDIPANPQSDSQFYNWENPVRVWALSNNLKDDDENTIKNSSDEDHKQENWPNLEISEPDENKNFNPDDTVFIKIKDNSHFPLKQIDFFFKNYYLGSLEGTDEKNYQYSFKLSDFPDLSSAETLRVKAYDTKGNTHEFLRNINISTEQNQNF